MGKGTNEVEPSHLEALTKGWSIKVWTPGLLLIVLACISGIAWMGASAGGTVTFFHYFVGLALFCVAGLAISVYHSLRLADEASRHSMRHSEMLVDLESKLCQMRHKQAIAFAKFMSEQSSRQTALLADVASSVAQTKEPPSIASGEKT